MPEKIVFIISTGRTGTKALAGFFDSSFENVKGYHQTRFSRVINIASNLYLNGMISKRLFYLLIRALKVNSIGGVKEEYYVEANCLNYCATEVLERAFDNVFIIHIVRDPRDFVRSYLNWIHTRFRSYIANRIVPFWHPSGFRTEDMSKSEWKQMGEFERICWHWKFKNQLIERNHGESPQYLRLRFEDLFTSANQRKGTLQKLLGFIGLPYKEELAGFFNTKKNVSKKTYWPKWEEWDERSRENLRVICGELIGTYEYMW